MNDEDLVFAAYRVILNLVIPPLRAKKLNDIKISWPCSTEHSSADWTVAAFFYKNRLVFIIWCADQNVMIGLPSLARFLKNAKNLDCLEEIFKEPIADPKCHVKILACVIDLITNLRNGKSRK